MPAASSSSAAIGASKIAADPYSIAWSASRLTAESPPLTMPSVVAPCSLAKRKAATVSSVSPEYDANTTSAPGRRRAGLRQMKS